MKGKFITFEGSECCGKSTQSKLLYEYLKKAGYPVVFLREPGGTKVSEKIRKILLDGRNDSITPETELLLYMASRAQTVKEVIEPALKKGKIVLCDRFLDSTIVYQGYGLGVDLKLIRDMGGFATGGIRPDLTILLDLSLKKALDGIGCKRDRIESRTFAYHLRVKKGYLTLARKEPARIKVVKLAENKLQTQARIRELALDALKGK
ncbi:MAG: dTMP kinase [Candidatus Omnitrophica bacterium]|jgi:dTMP kinase|nr:dTMP kinase [Candidatus Omnitrophota bacterium]